ncbi:MAG: hypothetical protein LBC85_09880 [Fibromonadaceae bacterium]|jgi:hypothetical protein|nr:hypothetical protein [Fibromonadaceae bacterium]
MKHNFYFFSLCFAAILAVSFFLVACGEGDIVPLGDTSTDRGQIGEIITTCTTNPEKCIPQVPSSSSQGSSNVLSSSSQDGGDLSSSSGSDVPSSNSGGVSSSSSGDAPSSNSGGVSSSSQSGGVSSSSATLSGTACPTGVPEVPNASCAWLPAAVVSGDNATVSLTGGEEECEREVFAEVLVFGTSRPVAFEQDKPMATSGSITNNSRTFTWPATVNPPTWSVATNDAAPNGIQGRIRCGDACSIVNCPITITAAPLPIKTPGTSIAFANIDHTVNTTNYYYQGSKPELTNTVTVSNNDATPSPGCEETATTVEIRPSSVLNAAGEVVAASGTFRAYAVVTCRGTKRDLDSTALMTVAPNPTLVGACTWAAKNNTFGDGETAITASGPTAATNSLGRCDTPYIAINGEEWDLKIGPYDLAPGAPPVTIANIAYHVKCGDDVIKGPDCPNITVQHPDDVDKCQYAVSDCGNNSTNYPTAMQVSTSSTNRTGEVCFFVADINGASQNDRGKFTVNGVECGNRAQCTAIDKKDGGYYIYVKPGNSLEGGMSWSFANGTPSCL